MCACTVREARRLQYIALEATKARLDASLTPAQVFASHAVLDEPDLATGKATILEAVLQQPTRVFSLPPREFERLIAQLLEQLGYRVHLTPQTRDGGKDIVALSSTSGRKFLIECKRYRGSVVGISFVQRMGGVVLEDDSRSFGLLVTTSHFSLPAQRYLDAESVRWRMAGVDFWGLIDWLDELERRRVGRIHNPFPTTSQRILLE
jgi:restriction system protein